MSFARECWYVACWADDLGAVPKGWIFLGEPVVLYRRADGAPVALEDRCCHRSLPLSMGMVEGDHIRCGYHGLKFDSSGACIEVPGQSAVPPEAVIRSYAVAEKWGAVWIWMGRPDTADAAKIPNVFWLDDPGWTPASGELRVEANYQLLIDNLMDVTHVSYLHRGTLAGDDIEAVTPVTTRREGDGVTVGRWILNVSAPPLYTEASAITGAVDRWQLITWEAPSQVYFDIGCATAGTGAPEGDRSQGVSMWSTHLVTPETETTTHYRFSFVRDFKLDDPAVTKILSDGARAAFLEDVEVLEAQQRAIEKRGARPTIEINTDNARLQVRRIVNDMIDAENSAAS